MSYLRCCASKFAAAAAGLLLACMGTTASAGVLNGESLRILFMSEPISLAWQKILQEMEAEAGGKIELEIIGYDELRQKVLLDARGDVSNYDLISIDLPWFGEFVGANVLLDLTDLIANGDIDVADFYKAAWEAGYFQGKQFGVPIQPQPELFGYRKDLFERDGIKPPETAADVLAAAKHFHGSEPGLSGICWNAARGAPLGQTMLQVAGAWGGPPVDLTETDDGFDISDIKPEQMKPQLDTDTAIASAKWVQSLLEYSPPGIANMAWDERLRVYGQGGCAMTYVWSGRATLYESDEKSVARGNTGYLPHPKGPNAKRHASTLGGYHLGIPANIAPERIEMAYAAIEWLASTELLKKTMVNGNGSTPRYSVAADPEIQKLYPAVSAVDKFSAEGWLASWPRAPVPEMAAFMDVLGTEYHKVVTGEATVEDAAKAAQRGMDRVMRKAGYY